MKKIFLIIIMLVTSIIAKPLNGDIDNTNDNIIRNTDIEEQIINLDNSISENEIVTQPQEESENVEIEKNIEIKEQDYEKDVAPKKESSNNSNQSQKIQEQPKVEKKQEIKKEPTTPIEEEPIVNTPPKVEPQPKQEEKIYCVDGGKIHIYGDGANEHGYYQTWDEAFKAYEEYTKGWESTQFKVDQCACGLYYFWVTK